MPRCSFLRDFIEQLLKERETTMVMLRDTHLSPPEMLIHQQWWLCEVGLEVS